MGFSVSGFSVYGFSEREFADAPRERFLAAQTALFPALSEDGTHPLINKNKTTYKESSINLIKTKRMDRIGGLYGAKLFEIHR